MELNSCLYQIEVMHCRVSPKRHRFNHKIFMFYLDLDELDYIDGHVRFFGRNRKRLFEFRDKDHLAFGKATVKENIIQYLKQKGVAVPIQRIMLLTNVRTAGYIFNPVSFYFCFGEDHQPVCAVCEVGNTFGELKPFFLGPDTWTGSAFSSVQKKYYYISPFVGLDIPMDFQLRIPAEKLFIKIDDLKDDKKFIYTTMSGKRQPLNSRTLFGHALKFPFVTLKVIFLIHLHAAILHYVKKVPYYRKHDNPDLQREVQRAYKDKKTF